MIPGTKTTFAMDMADFNKTLTQYSVLSSRSFVEIVHNRAANVIYKTLVRIPKNAPGRIRSELLAPSRINARAPLGSILINWNRGMQGKKGLSNSPMRKALRRMLVYRGKGSNYGREAWYGALRDLKTYTIMKRRPPTQKKAFKLKGKAIPERRRNPINPVCTIIHGNSQSASIPFLKNALRQGINADKADMMVYIRRKMGKDWQATKR